MCLCDHKRIAGICIFIVDISKFLWRLLQNISSLNTSFLSLSAVVYTHQESLSENLVAFATNKSSCKRGAYTVYHATFVKKQTIWALSFAMKHHNTIWALLIKRDYWSCLHFFNFKKMVIIGFQKKKKGNREIFI